MSVRLTTNVSRTESVRLTSSFSKTVAAAVVGSPGGSGRELGQARQAEGFSDQTHPGHHP